MVKGGDAISLNVYDAKVPDNTDSRPLYLSVGGSSFQISRGLIFSHPNNMLAATLSLDPNAGLSPDQPLVFTDRDPRVFEQVVLPYYRTGWVPQVVSLNDALVRHELDFWGIATQASALRKSVMKRYEPRVIKWLQGLLASKVMRDRKTSGYITLYIQCEPDFSNLMRIFDQSTLRPQGSSRKDIWRGDYIDVPWPPSLAQLLDDDGVVPRQFRDLEPNHRRDFVAAFVSMVEADAEPIQLHRLHPVLIHFYQRVQPHGRMTDPIQGVHLRAAFQQLNACEFGSELFDALPKMELVARANREFVIRWFGSKGFKATWGETRCSCKCKEPLVFEEKQDQLLFGNPSLWSAEETLEFRSTFVEKETQYPVDLGYGFAKFYPRSLPMACVYEGERHKENVFTSLTVEW